MKNIIIILVLLFSFTYAGAKPDMNLMKRILAQVAASNGYINKEMHTAFWDELRKSGSEQEAQKTASIIKKGLLPAQSMQMENYKSALLSYETRKVTKTKKLVALEKSQIQDFEKRLPYRKGSKNYQVAVNSFKSQLALNEKSSKVFYQAAANRTVWNTSDGRSIKITKEMLTKTISGMDKSFKRYERLLNPKWVN